MAKKAAKRVAKKKPATKKSAGKQGKSSAKLAAKRAAKQAAADGTIITLDDIKDALAEIKSLLQQLLRPQYPAPMPPYPLRPPGPAAGAAPSLKDYWPLSDMDNARARSDEMTRETKGLPPGLMWNGHHTDNNALSKAEY